jgi:hypothetical protein
LFNVTVTDIEAPVALCPDDISVTNDSGLCGATVPFTVNGTDNCPGVDVTVTANPGSRSLFPIGVTPVIVVATDAYGHVDSCSFNITVADTERPQAICPDDISVTNDSGICGAVVNYSLNGTDNCPGVTVASDWPSGATFPMGDTRVTVIATDVAGNADTCSFDVTVTDTEPPVALCPDDISVTNDSGACGAVVNYTLNGTDNCPGVIVTSDWASGALFPIGVTPVTVIAADVAGNADTCLFNVTVADTALPVVICPGDISVANDSGVCGAVVNYTINETDNCPGVVVTSDWASGALFPTGTTLVTVLAIDLAGNADSCQFSVTVTDTEAPVIECPADTVIDCGDPIAPPSTGLLVATDQCDPNPTISFYDTATRMVITRTWTATDLSGNSVSCDQEISYLEFPECDCVASDTTAPFIFCPPDITVACSDPSAAGTASATDDCDANPTITYSDLQSGDVITRTWTAADDAGHTSRCVQIITLQDSLCLAFSTGSQMSYTIFVDSLALDADSLGDCDEIGIFDGDICVGATAFHSAWPVTITAWEDDPTTPEQDGYIPGNPILARVALRPSCDQVEVCANPENWLEGDGTFGFGDQARVSLLDYLSCIPTSCCVGQRGDANDDGLDATILDLTFIVDAIFRGGPSAVCPDEADVNGDGAPSTILDLTYLVDRIFRGGPAPPDCP